jgi:hypothetical protein
MEEKLQTEEWVEEERIIRREAERKHLPKAHREEEPTEIKRKEKYPPPIKGFDKVEKTEKIEPIIFHLRRSTELKVPSLKEYSIIEKAEKIEPIAFYLNRSIELKILPLGEYHKIEHRGKVKPVLIKGEEYSPAFRIPELIEETAINNPSLIAPIKILNPDTARIVIPKVRFDEIPLPKCNFLQGERLEKDKAKEELETGELAIAGVSESTGGEVETKEIPDFLDLLFSEGSAGRVESGDPIVIYLEEPEGNSFIGALRTICKRIYREKKGGKPKPVIFSDVEELKKEIRWMEAEDKIFSAQLSKEEWKGLKKQDVERIFNRIDQLFSQHFGFIIFNTPFLHIPEHHRVDVIMLKPKELDTGLIRKISEIAWGFVKTEENGTFDYIFESARDKFEKTLKSISKERRGIYVDATKPNEGNESEEHLWIKWFLVKYLTQKLIEEGQLSPKPNLLQIKGKIKTEKDTKEENDEISADIKVGTEVYEVETLFSEDCEGKIARNKITHTIEKYESKNVSRINIVLDNLTFIRHFKELRDIKHNYKDWQRKHRKEIEFYTLDVEKWALVDIDKVAKKINEITREKIL